MNKVLVLSISSLLILSAYNQANKESTTSQEHPNNNSIDRPLNKNEMSQRIKKWPECKWYGRCRW